MNPHRVLGGLLALAILILANNPLSAQKSTAGSDELPLGDWFFSSGTLEPFAAIRANLVGEEWVLQPNADEPDFSFGWIEGPVQTVPPASDSLPGNLAGFRVHFTFSNGEPGPAPEIRLRMNTADFGQYAIGGITNNRFQQLAQGDGVASVQFDRTLLEQETDFHLFIDLLSVPNQGNISPDWEIRVESIEFFTTVSNSSFAREELINEMYMQNDLDVYAFVGGSREGDLIHRRSQQDAAVSFAFDGAFSVVIDQGELIAYTPLDDFAGTTIEAEDVFAAGISDQHVAYLKTNGEASYYNFITGEKTVIGDNDNFAGVIGSGDGTLVVIEINQSGTGVENFWQYDTRKESPSLETLLNVSDVGATNQRTTGIVGSDSKKELLRAAGIVPLLSGGQK